MGNGLNMGNWNGNSDSGETNTRIRNACKNTTMSDGSIANFFGVGIPQVKSQRERMLNEQPKKASAHKGRPHPRNVARIPLGLDQQGAAMENAEMGSKALREAYFRLYERRAKEDGLADVWEAAVVCGMAA